MKTTKMLFKRLQPGELLTDKDYTVPDHSIGKDIFPIDKEETLFVSITDGYPFIGCHFQPLNGIVPAKFDRLHNVFFRRIDNMK